MSAPRPGGGSGACAECLRRSWLLAQLSGPLDLCARDRARLLALLELEDGRLMDALAGRRRQEIGERHRCFEARELPCEPGVETTCRHRRGYPAGLRGRCAPPMLSVAGTAARLARLTSAPAVAIVGTSAASDYGMETAAGLARGAAACGLTVVASLGDGIAAAAHAGALEAGGASVAVMGGGLGVSCPTRRRALYARVVQRGCAVSELPDGCPGRRFGPRASERIVAGLAQLVVLVEADDTPGDLATARIALALGRPLAAVPGRVTSRVSRGANALLKEGAGLVRGPQDVLDLLHARGAGATRRESPSRARRALGGAHLEPRLRAVLDRIGCGCDTPDELARAGLEPGEVLLALSELELMGLIARGDGGRYVPRAPSPA